MNRLLRRTLYAGSAACCGAILWGASQASAAGDETSVDQVQQVLIGNSTDQGADASILNKQININLPVAVLAPGANAGDVTQSNTASNRASASNDNDTTQTVDQAQDASSAGGGGVDQQQSADVNNQTSQSAEAPVENRQVNVNLPVAVLSPRANVGDVTQSNEASNDALATNRNLTDQAVAQEQAADAASSTGHGPAGQAAVSQDQAADVANATSQEAQAPVVSEQSNEAAAAPSEPVAHGKGGGEGCGCDTPPPPPAPAGDVEQSNEATNVATAGNNNQTDQEVGQVQAAEAAGTKGATVSQDQSADVANATDQSAVAPISNDQANHADGRGDVTQSNAATNEAAANNGNRTDQVVVQGQVGDATAAGKHGDAAVVQEQSANVSNATDQSASAPIDNDQANVVADDHGKDDKDKDKGKGKGTGPHGPAPIPGDVTQSNEAANTAAASNVNRTSQGVVQGQAAEATGSKGHAAIVQTQSANPTNATRQAAEAPVSNDQRNVVKRGKAAGSVTQSNGATNDATAANINGTKQSVAQGQVASVVADHPKDHGPKSHGPKDHGPKDHGPKDHGPKDHGPKDHGPKGHGPKDHGPKHDECTPAPCAPTPCPR